MNTQELLELKTASDAEYKETRKFNAWWKAQEPLREWATAKLKEAFKALDYVFYSSEIKKVALYRERMVCEVERTKDTLSKEEYDKKILEALTIYENDEVRITGLIDYDMDCAQLKYTVHCKTTGLTVRNAEYAGQ